MHSRDITQKEVRSIFKKDQIIKICSCSAIDVLEGSLRKLNRQDAFTLLREGYKISHGQLSLSCFISNYPDNAASTQILEENTTNGDEFYLTCEYKDPISPQDDNLPIAELAN